MEDLIKDLAKTGILVTLCCYCNLKFKIHTKWLTIDTILVKLILKEMKVSHGCCSECAKIALEKFDKFIKNRK